MAIPFRFPNHGRALRPQISPYLRPGVALPMHDGFFGDQLPPETPPLGFGLEEIDVLIYSGDLRFSLLNGEGGLTIVQNDLERDDGLETAVLISMFSDRRASLEDPLPDASKDLRGWWADATLENNDKIGSRLWLLSRAKIENSLNTDAEIYLEESLQWMVDDGVADSVAVTVTRDGTYSIAIQVIIERPKGSKDITFKYFFNWEAQSLRIGL